MKVWPIAIALLAACTAQAPEPVAPMLELPNDPRIAVVANPTPPSMPADCVRADFVFDTASPPTVPTTRSDIENLSLGPLADRPAPLAILLGRVTMNLQDSHGDWVRSRPAWVVYRTGLMDNLPSGGPFIPGLKVARPVYRITAAITVIDALTGEHAMTMGCGIIRVS